MENKPTVTNLKPHPERLRSCDPVEIFRRDGDLQAHLKSLGIDTITQYIEWCKANGFSVKVKKNWKQRCKERFHQKQSLIESSVKHRRVEGRRPASVVDQIIAGESPKSIVRTGWLKRIATIAESMSPGPHKSAFRELLILAIETKSELLSLRTAHPTANVDSNSFIDGLATLASTHDHWLRPAGDWKPPSKNARKQFSSLVRHLVAKYAVPGFMDCVWFGGETDQQDQLNQNLNWFLNLANGASVRKLQLPLHVTKSMAKHFVSTPYGYSITAALRRAQVLSRGGDRPLVVAILDSRLAELTQADDVWVRVIDWLVRHPLLNKRFVGPLIDYIFNQVFPDGDEYATPRDFRLKGRSPDSVIRDLLQWHAALRISKGYPACSWPASSDIRELRYVETNLETGQRMTWTIQQILSTEELRAEGQALKHCVVSYASRCVDNSTTIWSMSLARDESKPRRVLTIEVRPDSRKIRQVRGKHNRIPKPIEKEVIKRWANEQGLN